MNDARNNDTQPCSLSRFGVERKPSAELLGHQGIYDMQAKAGPAFVAAGGEERIEGLSQHIGGHADAVVGKGEFDLVLADWSAPARTLQDSCQRRGLPEY